MNNPNPIWHPYTQEKLYPLPLKVQSGKDALLMLEDGRELIDGISSWWVNLFGHGRREIADAIAEQALKLEHVIFAGFTHQPALDLGRSLLDLTGHHYAKVFLSDNGSTAVEVGLKIALQYFHNRGVRGKLKILALEEAYHGDTFGAMSVGARTAFSQAFDDLLFDVCRLPSMTDASEDEIMQCLHEHLSGGDVAAFIFEPLVMGTAGMKMYDASLLDKMMQAARDHQVLLIADEVMTGFGRTGPDFACEYLQVQPDILCLSKGITGGFMPLGATLATAAIYENFYSDNRSMTFFHGHSYTGNPLACAAANASIQLLKSEEMTDNRRRLSTRLTKMRSELAAYPNAANLRVKGQILAFEIETSSAHGYFNPLRDTLYNQALEQGVLLRPLGNTLYLMPPYCITETQLDRVEYTFKQLLENNQ